MQTNSLLLIFVVLALAIVFMGVKGVSQGYQWTVERLGRSTTPLTPGLNPSVPLMDRIGRTFDLMPLEASQALGGIGEIVKATFDAKHA